MAITLAQLKAQSRQMADMKNNNFVEDSELVNYINFAIAELYDLLIQSFSADYYVTTTGAVNTVSGQDAYDLPEDFYKLRGVDIKLNRTSWTTLKPFNFNERNRYDDFGSWTITGVTNIRYRLMGNQIRLIPTPDSARQYQIWYIPKCTKLVDDTDELDDLNQYSEFVIVTAAMKMLHKEESDVSALAAERKRLIDRIIESSQNRDVGDPESISDIYAENNDYWWYTTRT